MRGFMIGICVVLVLGLFKAKNRVVLPEIFNESYATWKCDRDFR